MVTDNDIKEYLDDLIEQDKDFTSREIRNTFGIGGSRFARIIKEYVDADLIESSSTGYKIVNSFLEDVNVEEVEEEEDFTDEELDEFDPITKLQVIQKRLQHARDEANYLRRINRNKNREESYFDEVIKSLDGKINKIQTIPEITKIGISDNNNIALVNLSDLHLGETVLPEDVKDSNEFNWDIASKRLQKFAVECKRYVEFHDINKMIIIQTGDMFNSNRRYDELVRNSDSLTVSLLKGVELITKFILDVSINCETRVYSVFGNESRIHKDYTSVHWESSFDYLLHHIVSIKLSNIDRITFINPSLDHSQVISVLGCNILLIHGHNKTNINKEIAKFAHHPINPLIINYVLYGHIHETKNELVGKRSASLVGNNAYSFHQLGIHGSAEQNLHILIKESPDRIPVLRTIAINLDNTLNYNGYQLDGLEFKETLLDKW